MDIDNKRKEEVYECLKSLDKNVKTIVQPLADDMLDLEVRLEEIKSYPHFKVSDKDPTKQKVTECGKLYHKYMQTYTNIVKTISSFYTKTDTEDLSPIREYFKLKMSSDS